MGYRGVDPGRGASVTGQVRHPGAEQSKASQKRSRPAPPMAVVATPPLQPGDRMRWSRYTGTVQRVVGDLAEVVEATLPHAGGYR